MQRENNLIKGKAYMKGGALIEEPMDFSEKNYLPLSTMHESLKAILFPNDVEVKMRFELTDKDTLSPSHISVFKVKINGSYLS